jgi:NAD+ synthase
MDKDALTEKLRIRAQEVGATLTHEINSYLKETNREHMVFGLSGGLDSAVVAALCAKVGDPSKIMALIMPDKESSRQNTLDAIELARDLGIRYRLIYLDPYLESAGVRFPVPFIGYRMKAWLVRKLYKKMERQTGETPFQTILKGGAGFAYNRYLNKGTANYRFKHRLRLTFLYQAAEEGNAMVVGAANRTEYLTGFFVKYGIDHNADIMPLLNLYKTQIYELASWLQLPEKFVQKPPTPDMIPGITDEYAFEVPYRELDALLYALENDVEPEGTMARHMEYVRSLYRNSKYMRRMYVPDAGQNNVLRMS